MMDKLTEEEKFLLLGKLTGSLTAEEEAELNKLFQDNPDAQAAYKDLENNIPIEDTATYFANRRQLPVWKDLTMEFRENEAVGKIKSIGYFRRNWAVAAAIFIGVLAGGGALLMFLRTPSRKGELPIVHSPARKANIELTLANGKVINLTSEQGPIDAEGAQLSNMNKSLTYSLKNNLPSGANILTVPVGMDYKINLADGSEVWLNAATKLEFPLSFPGKTREIRINGEAYIKVAKDVSKPFIVHLPKISVQVLGTEFNVNTYDEGVEKVALVTGAVNLKAPKEERKLVPGVQAIYAGDGSIRQENFDPKYVLSWRKGLFFFNNASLADISKVVPRWYGIQLIVDDPEIYDRRFTGVINRNRPITLFLEDLKVISRIDSWFDKDSTLHLKQSHL